MRKLTAIIAIWALALTGLLVSPATAGAATAALGSLDLVTLSADGRQVTVDGWTLDPNATSVSTQVHIYVGGNGYARLADKSRPDVNAVFGVTGRHGFSETVPLAAGSNQVCVFAISATDAGNTLLGCRAVEGHTDRPALGSLDLVTLSADGRQVTVDGWTLDPNATSVSTQVHIYVGGNGYARLADKSRPDVNAVFGVTGRHGFSETVPLAAGSNQVCVFAISTTDAGNTLLGCRAVEGHTDRPALGSLDLVTLSADGRQVTVDGWTLDPNATSVSTQVHIYVGGNGYARLADKSRPDVNAVFGVTGRHGFSETVPLAAGSNQVCVFAISATDAGNTLLGCRTAEGPKLIGFGFANSAMEVRAFELGGESLQYLTPLPGVPAIRHPDPQFGVRDPSITRHSGRYWLVATRALKNDYLGTTTHVQLHVSDDLVTWRHVMDLPADVPGAYRTWAPEFLTDADGSVYLYYAVSTQPVRVESTTQFDIYARRANDNSMTSWGPPQLARGLTRTTNANAPTGKVIDAQVSRLPNGPLVMYVKDEERARVMRARATSPLGPWAIDQILDLGGVVEGPELLGLPGGRWRLFYDLYIANRIAFRESADLQTWGAEVTVVQTGPEIIPDLRHPGYLWLSAAEWFALRALRARELAKAPDG